MATVNPITKPSYLNAVVVKPISRGATAFAPAYAQVPWSGYNGFPFRSPHCAPGLLTTITSLNALGGAAGYPFNPPGSAPLIANVYENADTNS